MKRVVKAWVFPYKRGLACPDSRPGTLLVQIDPKLTAIYASDGRGDLELCYGVDATITYDDGKPAKRKRRKGTR